MWNVSSFNSRLDASQAVSSLQELFALLPLRIMTSVCMQEVLIYIYMRWI